MLSQNERINVPYSLMSLNRSGYTLTGLTPTFDLLEVDLKHHVVDTLIKFSSRQFNNYNVQASKKQQNKNHQKFENVIAAKYLKTYIGKGYYFMTKSKLQFENGLSFFQSNKKSQFIPGFKTYQSNVIDGKDEFIGFIKEHKNHNKYSLNLAKQNMPQKKILRLFEEKIQSIHIFPQTKDTILFQKQNKQIWMIYGKDFKEQKNIYQFPFVELNSQIGNNQFQILKNIPPQLHYDDTYSYIANQTKDNSTVIRVIDEQEITRNKNYITYQILIPSSKDLYRSTSVRKIQSFRNDLIIGLSNKIVLFDIRKLAKPYQQKGINQLSSFYYEPNLSKLYASCQDGIIVYSYK